MLPAQTPTPPLEQLEFVLHATYLGLLIPLALLGMHRAYMVYLWMKKKDKHPEAVPFTDDELPTVTIQLPLFNERYVAARLIEAVGKMDYPREKLKVQVLDDSTDESVEICARAVAAEKAKGLDIDHIRRPDRVGFKAGALDYGLQQHHSEFVAVFDADFLPPSDFLRRTVPHFRDEKVGMVQTRWGHLNDRDNLLTETQATLLDGHFLVEHVARSRSNLFFNFNGTGGVFRRQAIESAGGWQHDTITEDLDLSYRSQLKGWKFVYDPRVVCPAELPPNMNAFQIQQYRWAKGAIQVGRKLLVPILKSDIGFKRKLEAGVHLLGNFAFPLILLVVLTGLPLQLVRYLNDSEIPFIFGMIEGSPLFCATFSVFAYYGTAAWQGGRRSVMSMIKLPWLVASGAALCVNNTTAVFAAFDKDPGEFVRTPKQADKRNTANVPLLYRSKRGVMPWIEISLAAWALITAFLSLQIGMYGPAFFHGLFAGGLGWAGTASLLADRRAAKPVEEAVATTAG